MALVALADNSRPIREVTSAIEASIFCITIVQPGEQVFLTLLPIRVFE